MNQNFLRKAESFFEIIERNNNKAIILVILVGIILRLSFLDYHGLWDDEIFSYIMSSGHSIEHLETASDLKKEDYLQPAEIMKVSFFKKFFYFDKNQSTTENVIRAVFMSDTSPPLYYIVLNLWERIVGTSDFQLRFFSFLFWFFSLFLLSDILKKMGKSELIFFTIFFYSLTPYSVYFSTEGRHYTMLMFFALIFLWSAVCIEQEGFRPLYLILYFFGGAGGFLVHYFFLFLYLGVFLWQLDTQKKDKRGVFAIVTMLLFLFLLNFWYYKFPIVMSQWTYWKDWLVKYSPFDFNPILSFWDVYLYFFSAFHPIWSALSNSGLISFHLFYLALFIIVRKTNFKNFFSEKNNTLIFLWALCPILGLTFSDVIRSSHATGIPRYWYLAMPATYILFSYGLYGLKKSWKFLFLMLFLVSFLPGFLQLYKNNSRHVYPFKEAAKVLNSLMEPSDLLVLISDPKGIFGLCRYLKDDMKVVVWSDKYGSPDSFFKITAELGKLDHFYFIRKSVTAEEPFYQWIEYFFARKESFYETVAENFKPGRLTMEYFEKKPADQLAEQVEDKRAPFLQKRK